MNLLLTEGTDIATIESWVKCYKLVKINVFLNGKTHAILKYHAHCNEA